MPYAPPWQHAGVAAQPVQSLQHRQHEAVENTAAAQTFHKQHHRTYMMLSTLTPCCLPFCVCVRYYCLCLLLLTARQGASLGVG